MTELTRLNSADAAVVFETATTDNGRLIGFATLNVI